MGYGFTDDEHKADLVLVNTCAIREHAEQRVLGNVGALTHTKRANPGQIICLCGCMAQEEHVARKGAEVLPSGGPPLRSPRPVALPGAAVALPGHRKAGL